MRNDPPGPDNPSFFDPRRAPGSNDQPGQGAVLPGEALATEFAHPERPGRWTVVTGRFPWQIVDGHGALRLLGDDRANVARGDGFPLYGLQPKHHRDLGSSFLRFLAKGPSSGSAVDVERAKRQRREDISRENDGPPNAWLILGFGRMVIAKTATTDSGVHIDLLPANGPDQ